MISRATSTSSKDPATLGGITLGACFAAQAVGAYRALQMLNPMPCKLVAVEPEPENIPWIRRHMRDNGIDPVLE
jgi:3-oxoacyl-(acyl-carrier-protein) synthase